MHPGIIIILVAACVASLLFEKWRGLRVLDMQLKGDIKRETWWLQQYGQAVCTPVAALLVWELDPEHSLGKAGLVFWSVVVTSLVCGGLKRLVGRVRPGRENAGRFLGPQWAWRGNAANQSFPSSHTACAVALTTVLTALYPHGWSTFWGLAIACAVLRYVMDAHWISDIFGGFAIGYAVAWGMVAIWPDVVAAMPAWFERHL